MKTLHHGAVNGVTGSCHQLVIDSNNSLLVDCGLFQGDEKADKANKFTDAASDTSLNDPLTIDFDISTVQALLVTHCHIDHVGRIPYLLAAGFTGPIVATEATVALLPMVIEDALKVGVTRNKRIIEACLSRLTAQLVAVPYKQWFDIPLQTGAAAKVKFQPAGHILGSAYIEIDINSHIDTRAHHSVNHASISNRQRVVFSGDLGATYSPLLAAPKSPYKADLLIIESTYGDRVHQGRKARVAQLTSVLEKAIADNGVVIIPAFSIGRTQELLYELEQIITKSNYAKLSDIEVIVDSPMAAKFTEYYQRFQLLWDKEAKRRVKQGRQPLNFDSLYTVDSHQQHLQTIDYLAKRNKPAIVIAASGMCSGGRVVNYLKRFLSQPTADVLFVGYQAKGTLGRDIQYYGPDGGYVIIEAKKYPIKAGIHTISGYSAHADQANLVNFVKRIRKRPQKVIIVHGDENAKQSLAKKLQGIVSQVEIGS
ncbi:MBL fold metallo-hydrolase RNA specificity domain-containing protein [Shewanella donghaensis]|uniref:MBL fold metallo-hydrolase RNA specificity domain-containing protein n=1 Tax=Shewanella donghaensis TaxID=238836 RepID=UPI00118346E0|nr:MBL fold metallo-hydrolase [Shewanella donghaensis]